MTDYETSDRDVERAIRSWLREDRHEDASPVAGAVLHQAEAIPQRRATGWPAWRTPIMNKIAGIGLVAVAVVAAVVVGVQLLGPNGTGVVPGSTATPGVGAPEQEVKGWPTTTENPAGVYSWNRIRCAGQYCNLGFMHNGYGSGDVDITIQSSSAGITPDDGTLVTVAGHEGIYRRIDAQREQWIVEIGETTVVITITAEIGTSQADLDEAHAIIDSMRTELMDTNLGFRIVFTLTTDDWDSG